MTHQNGHDKDVDVIAETENFFVWHSTDDDGSIIFHVELGGVSLHLVSEEWEELLALIASVE